MKLKQIPTNTVVHTPTEEEARELLDILHENGWKWIEFSGEEDDVTYWERYEHKTCYNLKPGKIIDCEERDFYADEGYTILKFSKFKERYCEQEKPQPKFKKGDIVRVIEPNCWHSGQVGIVRKERTSSNQVIVGFSESGGDNFYSEECLEPYTEPETKEEAMETKELNLCELLKGHEEEIIFLTTMGEVLVEKVSEEHLFFRLRATEPGWRLNANGKMSENGVVITYPSRALYEQYPLDPYTAWMKWQEEQKKYLLEVKLHTYDASNFQEDFYFRTTADRDKCIEEIKAIIEKYSK